MSIVIAAFNERPHLPRLLESLRHQTHHPVEIFVIDDGSTDGTREWVPPPPARLVRQSHVGAARARNHGAALCSGDVLVFIDGDMWASPTYIEALVAPIDAGAIGSFTKEIFLGNAENAWARAYAGIRGQGSPRLIPDAFPDRWENFRAVRREAFLAIGGYDDVGYGEDMTLAPKLKQLAVAAPGAVCWHNNPSSLSEVFGNGRWIGRGKDIEQVDVWSDNNPGRVFLNGVREARASRSAVPLIARSAYHLGVAIGLIDKRRGRHHAK